MDTNGIIPEELPDESQKSSGAQQGGEDPLKDKKIPVARISRHRMAMIGFGIFLLAAVSCALALSPRKKLSAQELTEKTAQATQADAKPNLPENIAAAPTSYGETPRLAASTSGGGAGLDPLERNDAAGASQAAAASGEVTISPRDQRLRDAASATRAPLSFGGVAKAHVPPEAVPLREAAPLPELSGVNRMIEKLSVGQGTEADDQNQQGEKRGFARENRNDFPYLKTTLLTPISPYEVKAGTILPGVLITGINSDLPGEILAQARENVYDTATGRYLLIPLGSRFVGEYDSKVSYGQERVLVIWTRIIMPNGNSISLENMPGVDLSGYAGVTGWVNNHYGKLITGVVLGSMIGAGAQVAVGGQGAPNVPPSFGQLFVAGAAGNLNQAGQRITEKNLNLQPTIQVEPGQKINIFVTKDMIFKPYTE